MQRQRGKRVLNLSIRFENLCHFPTIEELEFMKKNAKFKNITVTMLNINRKLRG